MAMVRDIKDVTYIKLTCNVCGEFEEALVRVEDIERYNKGVDLIQHCFPYLSPSQREMIISKTCESCWKELFDIKFD